MKKEEYGHLWETALCRLGNLSRFREKIDILKENRDITIAYAGGSITQDVGATKHDCCYARRSYEGLKRLLVSEGGLTSEQAGHLCYHNAGLAGTGSQLCAVRYETAVELDGQLQPDIVVVEFCVNDSEDETRGVFYESLVRRILQKENKPAVILLFSVFENGFNLQQRLTPVAKHYDLPLINIKKGVYAQFDAAEEKISKQQYFADPLHPSDMGHEFMADCLSYFFEKALQTEVDFAEYVVPDTVVYGKNMEGMRLLDRSHPCDKACISEGAFKAFDRVLQDGTLPDNWAKRAGNSDTDLSEMSFCMEIETDTLVAVLKDSDDVAFGKVEIYVDGEFCRYFDPHVDNWVHCHALLLFRNKPGKHKIEIRPQRGEENKAITILGFGYC